MLYLKIKEKQMGILWKIHWPAFHSADYWQFPAMLVTKGFSLSLRACRQLS